MTKLKQSFRNDRIFILKGGEIICTQVFKPITQYFVEAPVITALSLYGVTRKALLD